MHSKVELTITPNEKYHRVVDGYADPDGDDTNEAEWNDWPDEHKEAADAYLSVAGAATPEPRQVSSDEYTISCPHCGRKWQMEARRDGAATKSDLKSRLDAHLPCDEREELSWDLFSPANDPDLLANIATYFEGMEPSEPTDRLRAKCRLLDCDVYATAQTASRAELRE